MSWPCPWTKGRACHPAALCVEFPLPASERAPIPCSPRGLLLLASGCTCRLLISLHPAHMHCLFITLFSWVWALLPVRNITDTYLNRSTISSVFVPHRETWLFLLQVTYIKHWCIIVDFFGKKSLIILTHRSKGSSFYEYQLFPLDYM